MGIDNYLTVAEACTPQQAGRERKWMYRALKLGKIHATRIGRYWLIPSYEIKRIRNGEVTISREEMGVR